MVEVAVKEMPGQVVQDTPYQALQATVLWCEPVVVQMQETNFAGQTTQAERQVQEGLRVVEGEVSEEMPSGYGQESPGPVRTLYQTRSEEMQERPGALARQMREKVPPRYGQESAWSVREGGQTGHKEVQERLQTGPGKVPKGDSYPTGEKAMPTRLRQVFQQVLQAETGQEMQTGPGALARQMREKVSPGYGQESTRPVREGRQTRHEKVQERLQACPGKVPKGEETGDETTSRPATDY